MKIISEIGINHNGDFRKIEELVRQSAIGGADYAKFQLYDSIRVFGDDSRKHNEFTFNQVRLIKDICDTHGIEFFASVFDEEKIEWCERLDVNLYKIASRTVVKEPSLSIIITLNILIVFLDTRRVFWISKSLAMIKMLWVLAITLMAQLTHCIISLMGHKLLKNILHLTRG